MCLYLEKFLKSKRTLLFELHKYKNIAIILIQTTGVNHEIYFSQQLNY